MRWHILIIVLLLAPLAGCRGTRPSDVWQSVLDAEKRALEDRAYALESEADALRDQLASTRRENDALRNELDEQDNNAAPLPRRRLRSPSTGESESMVPDSLDGPMIELNESSPAEELPVGTSTILNAASQKPATTVEASAGTQEASTSLLGLGNLGALGGRKPAAPETDRVVGIALNPMLTGGDDRNNRPGDEGLSVVIEPQNVDGLYVPQAGSVSVVLLDPAKSGSAARVARWDFDIGEAQARLKTSALGRGIHLALPWPNKPPENTRLHLFVRYTTADQRRLEADREVHIDLAGKLSARWTPAAGAVARQGESRPMVVTDLPSSQKQATSPYVADQTGSGGFIALDREQATREPSDDKTTRPLSLESRRIEVAQREEEQPAAAPAEEQPARKLKQPKWQPFR